MKRLIVPVLSVMMLTSTAMAGGPECGGKHHDRPHHENKVEFLSSKLDLTDDQKAKLEALQKEYASPDKNMREQMKAIHDEMEALDVTAPDYDQKLNALADKVAQDASQQAKNRILFGGKMKAVLTPEQRAALKDIMPKRPDEKGPHK